MDFDACPVKRIVLEPKRIIQFDCVAETVTKLILHFKTGCSCADAQIRLSHMIPNYHKQRLIGLPSIHCCRFVREKDMEKPHSEATNSEVTSKQVGRLFEFDIAELPTFVEAD